jgi:hypothetical protein
MLSADHGCNYTYEVEMEEVEREEIGTREGIKSLILTPQTPIS